MTQFKSDGVRNAAARERPSLYGKAANPSGATTSILRGLEPDTAKPAFIRRVAWGVPFVSFVVVLLVVALNGGFQYPRPVGMDSQPVAQQGAAREAMSPPVSFVPPTATDMVSQPDVATIISEQRQEHAEKDEAALVRLLAESESRPGPASAGDANAEAAFAQTAPKDAVIRKPDALKVAAKGTPPIAKSRPTAATAGSSKAAAKGNGKDRDVDLIAALLTHVSSPTAGEKAKARVNVSDAPRTSSAQAASGRERKASPNRDVVTQAPGESTESLVARCRALGFFEGELCRVRVCSGLWGKDAACPSSATASSG